MEPKHVLYEVCDRVATITLNRPEKLNALTLAMERELQRVWAEAMRDPKVIVCIVTGAGEKAFCSGLDVQVMPEGARADELRESGGVARALHFTAIQNQCWKPVITAVNGLANGGGLEFIADSDIVIAAEGATFFDTHTAVGLISTYAMIVLSRRIPFEAVMRMALVGGRERMTARRACEIGLVSEVTPQDQLQARAREIAGLLLENSPATMMATKRALWEARDFGLAGALAHGREALRAAMEHPDWQEGVRAFREKRVPRWAPPG